MSYPSYDLTWAQIQARAFRTAKSHGWWDDCCVTEEEEARAVAAGNDDLIGGRVDIKKVEAKIPEKLCLIHSEVSEALECFRDHKLAPYRISPNGVVTPEAETASFDTLAKPEGFPSELADILIRIGDLAGAMGIDLEAAVEAKLRYNETRPYRHGGKAV